MFGFGRNKPAICACAPCVQEPLLATIVARLGEPISDDVQVLFAAAAALAILTVWLRLSKLTLFWSCSLSALLMPPIALWRPDTLLVAWVLGLVAGALQRGLLGDGLAADVKELGRTSAALKEEMSLLRASLKEVALLRKGASRTSQLCTAAALPRSEPVLFAARKCTGAGREVSPAKRPPPVMTPARAPPATPMSAPTPTHPSGGVKRSATVPLHMQGLSVKVRTPVAATPVSVMEM